VAKRSVRAVVFDWYETLAMVTVEMRLAMFDRVACEAGLDLPVGTLGEQWREATRAERGHPFDGPVPPFRSFRDRWRERGKALLEQYGVRGGGELVARHYAGLHASASAYPEAAPVLERLASRRQLGVLSDADTEFLRLSIDRAGFTFAAVACSEELQNYKPHIETFRAARATRCTAARGALRWRSAAQRHRWCTQRGNENGLDQPEPAGVAPSPPRPPLRRTASPGC
jgi:FMN phosphatase YigB (HAD superfamily)